MRFSKRMALLVSSTAALVVPAGCASEATDAEPALGFRSPDGQVKRQKHDGGRDWLYVPGDSLATGPVSLSTEHRFAGIVRRLRDEGLVVLPDCAGLPDEVGQEGEDPIPGVWFQGLEGSPGDGYVITVAYDGECEPDVTPFEPGNVDPHPNDPDVQFDATQCDEGENEVGAQSLICDRLDVLDPMTDPRLVYPAIHEDLSGVYTVETEEECIGIICETQYLRIDPIDPMPDDSVIPVEADCEMIPELCELEVEILDINDLLMGDDDSADDPEPPPAEQPKDPEDDECSELIERYNNGEVGCSHAVAACAADGVCHSKTDDGYIECADNGSTNDCIECKTEGGGATGSCSSYDVSVENTDDNFPIVGNDVFDDNRSNNIVHNVADRDGKYKAQCYESQSLTLGGVIQTSYYCVPK